MRFCIGVGLDKGWIRIIMDFGRLMGDLGIQGRIGVNGGIWDFIIQV